MNENVQIEWKKSTFWQKFEYSVGNSIQFSDKNVSPEQ